jgi:hypothetical protein
MLWDPQVIQQTSPSVSLVCQSGFLGKHAGGKFLTEILVPLAMSYCVALRVFPHSENDHSLLYQNQDVNLHHVLLRSCIFSSASCDRSSRMHLGGTRPSPVNLGNPTFPYSQNLGNPTFPHSQIVESWDWVQAKCILGRRSVLVHPENWGQSQCLLGI